MSGVCQSCMMKGNHRKDKDQFVIKASGDFRHSLRIPEEVAGHLRNMISQTVKLQAPNGRSYHIGVGTEMGELVLQNGWEEFVTGHNIKENYSLLFMYRGDSTFMVHIFSSHCCDEAFSCSQQPSEILGAVPPSTSCVHHVLNDKAAPNPEHVQPLIDFDYIMSTGSRLTKSQDEKVLQIAQTMRSEIPLYVAAMNKTSVNLKDCFINIPLMLVNRFKEGITKATIKLEGPDCHVYSVGASKLSNDEIVLQSGWGSFVAAHRIQETDFLIFRSKGETRLEVLILDPSCCQKTSSCFVMGNLSCKQEVSEGSVEVVEPPPHEVIDLSSSSDDDRIVGEGTRKSCRLQKRVEGGSAKPQEMASTSSPSTKSGRRLSRPFHPPYILTKGTTLPELLEKRVQEKVQAVRSEVPICVALIGKSNVCEYTGGPGLRFCREYASAYLPNRSQTLMLELEDKEWNTTMNVNSENRACLIYRGWPEFVSQNHLQLGDVCLFELVKNAEPLRMIVHFIRQSEMQL